MGRGANNHGEGAPEHPALAIDTHRTNETKPSVCPTCGQLVPDVPLGRPRVYCTDGCRVEMVRRRRDLANLVAERDHHLRLATGRVRHWRQAELDHAAHLEPLIAAARARVYPKES